MNLGAILHLNGKLSEAEANYLRALQLKPDDAITQSNLRKLWNIMERQGVRTKLGMQTVGLWDKSSPLWSSQRTKKEKKELEPQISSWCLWKTL